ncbi:hypothetical protein GBAR_LOCUS6074, partial [Geodia barretti]
MFYEFQLVRSGQIPLKGPVTAAATCESCVCVCVGSSLCALSERLNVFAFDQELDAVACWSWSDTECLAAAADRGGCVHVLSPRLKTVTINSLVVTKLAQPSLQPVFSALKPVLGSCGSLCLLVLTVAGSLHIVHSRDCGGGEVVSVDVTTDHGLVAVCSISNLSHIITLRRETWPLSVWRLEKQPFSLTVSLQVSALLSESSPVVQVETTGDGSYIVVLTEEGEVSVWLAEVMVVLGVWGGRRGQPFISQFSLSSYKGMEPCHLCVLCHDSSPSKDLLVVMSVPGLQWLFSTEVSPGS